MSKVIDINIVNGSSGFSLQISDNKGFGYRVVGPKAWGNPFNKPLVTFKNVDVDNFIEKLREYQFDKEG